ncbi:hypothetical protein SAMN03159424_02556 [Pseudomonas sp. NFACC05-1]|nr:hypothetical protein SAMN03159424_02556 [Pseudomonas sp. NFACC05-1]
MTAITDPDRNETSRSIWALQAILCLVAFAANSIFCRQALMNGQIDPDSFTAIRLLSGGVFLLLLIRRRNPRPSIGGSWRGGHHCCAGGRLALERAYVDPLVDGLSRGTGGRRAGFAGEPSPRQLIHTNHHAWAACMRLIRFFLPVSAASSPYRRNGYTHPPKPSLSHPEIIGSLKSRHPYTDSNRENP